MFTGLKAINHFGRPDMPSFLKFVQKKHSYVSNQKHCNLYGMVTAWGQIIFEFLCAPKFTEIKTVHLLTGQ